MKTFILILIFSLFSQVGKQYDIEWRCYGPDDCHRFESVITITPHKVYFHKPGSPNGELEVTKTFFEKGREYHQVEKDTVVNDSSYVLYTGWVVVVPEPKSIHVELRLPLHKQYFFTTFKYK